MLLEFRKIRAVHLAPEADMAGARVNYAPISLKKLSFVSACMALRCRFSNRLARARIRGDFYVFRGGFNKNPLARPRWYVALCQTAGDAL